MLRVKLNVSNNYDNTHERQNYILCNYQMYSEID